MKKSELKTIIKECVKETLLEEGMLSEIIAEVAFGIAKAQSLIAENKTPNKVDPAVEQRLLEEKKENQRKQLLETKKKMLDAIGGEKMKGVFEGTSPLSNSGQSSPHSPLAGKDPNDAGVDISGLFGLAGQKWQQLK